MRVIIAGSRSVAKWTTVNDAIRESGFNITEVVSGGCRGPDHLGEWWAKVHHVPVTRFSADWGLGRKAGPIRNQRMADYAEALIAVWDGSSRGTLDMIRRARVAGLQVYVHELGAGPERRKGAR